MSTYVMAPKHWIVYDGKSLNDFNVYTSGEATFNSPEKNYETIEIVGRNGDLTIDYGTYKNIDVTYNCFIPYDLEKNARAFRSFLGSKHGYFKLEDTRHPEEYRIARVLNGLELSTARLDIATFELIFNCKPQRYLRSGDKVTAFTSSGTLFNPSYMPAKPLLKIYGSGTGTITINDTKFTVTSLGGGMGPYVLFDTEMLNAYFIDSYGKRLNRNGCILDNSESSNSNGIEDLELVSGNNTISFTGGVTSIEVTPRWWTL